VREIDGTKGDCDFAQDTIFAIRSSSVMEFLGIKRSSLLPLRVYNQSELKQVNGFERARKRERERERETRIVIMLINVRP